MTTYDHFVPQFYLDGFLDPSSIGYEKITPYLWAVDLENRKIKPKAPVNIAGSKGYNDLPATLDSTNKAILETIYKKTEGYTAPIIKKLRKHQFQISDQERADLATFIAFQITRVPLHHKNIDKNLDELENFLSQKSKPSSAFESERHREDIVSLTSIIEAYDYYGGLIFSRRWSFLITKENTKFFTSDNPVQMLSPDGEPLKIDFTGKNEKLKISFPISSSCILLMEAPTENENIGIIKIYEIESNMVDKLNRRVLSTIEKFAFCSSREQGEWILTNFKKESST
jgi:hypothetical protein